MAVTIKDVAQLAGVSISTVSRVIKTKASKSSSKKKSIGSHRGLDYKPNQVARSLVTKNLI